ncbi:MAG TPA: helix-turn-helix domain-containing protein [Candidatus Binataceae bacterium]
MKARKPLSDEILTAKEVANFLPIHPSTIYGLAKSGDLWAFPVGVGVIGASVAFHLSNGWNPAGKMTEGWAVSGSI